MVARVSRRRDVEAGAAQSTSDLAMLTAQFLALPVARFVTELRRLASFESDNDSTRTLAAVAELASRAGHHAAGVRRLHVRGL